jgi:hypothetical protein
MYLAVDCEGHLGTDQRFYILDAARLFPPTTPLSSIKGGHLYRLCRPELVRKWKTTLCSDAFSAFHLENKEHEEEELKKVVKSVLNDIHAFLFIPFVCSLSFFFPLLGYLLFI